MIYVFNINAHYFNDQLPLANINYYYYLFNDYYCN